MAFPSILLAIAIMASLGPSATNVFISLAVVYTPTVARLVRSTTLVTKQQPYVESARSIGMSDRAILLQVHLPKRPLAADRPVHVCRRLRDHLGGVAVVPRRRGQSGNPHLGKYAARWSAGVAARLVAVHVPRHRIGADRAFPQPARRWAAGCARSPGPEAINLVYWKAQESSCLRLTPTSIWP